jgi:hypothetical protein
MDKMEKKKPRSITGCLPKRICRVHDQHEHQPSWKKAILEEGKEKAQKNRMTKPISHCGGMKRKKLGQQIYRQEEET